MKDTCRRYQALVKGALSVLAMAVFLAGCSYADTGSKMQDTAQATVSEQVRNPNIYDSEDMAVVVKKDTEAKTIQFQNIATSRRYTLSYSGVTKLYDKYGQAISVPQLKEGSMVTVRFYKPDKSLAYISESADCVSYNHVRNYSMDLSKGTITIGTDQYNISGHVVVSSGGRETDMMEVNQVDEISVWGYKNMVYGIHVEKGHGYLRLQNEDYFVGGWLDVGDKVIRKVAADMLLVVPEGTYNVTVSNRGSSATQEITFARNEEMAWDLGSVEITAVQRGTIIFTLTPATAKVAIDGHEVDVSRPVTLDYGIHQMRIAADGYESVAQYIKVAEPSANISVELDKSEEEQTQEAKDEDDSTDTSSLTDASGEKAPSKKYTSSPDDREDAEEEEDDDNENTAQAKNPVSSTGNYKVYIDAPEGVEAYLDGSYIGITPISFNKTAGNYVVTLRKAGYQTRSYTLQIDDSQKDVNYSFTELIELDD